jgi:hypothetical protein
MELEPGLIKERLDYPIKGADEASCAMKSTVVVCCVEFEMPVRGDDLKLQSVWSEVFPGRVQTRTSLIGHKLWEVHGPAQARGRFLKLRQPELG